MSTPNDASLGSIEEIDQFESIRLFVECARSVKPSFVLDERNAASVVGICNRLDGIPLAIKLAAGEVTAIEPDEILDRLNDRFSLLQSANRSLPARQRTLHAAIDWSFELLNEQERTFFAAISAFQESWTLKHVESVLASLGMNAYALLKRLIDKSLIQVVQSNESTRYRLLESIKEFAASKLAALEIQKQIQDAHAAYFANLVVTHAERTRGPDKASALDAIDAEYPNVRAALQSLTEQMPEYAAQAASALMAYWTTRGYWKDAEVALTKLLSRRDELSSQALGDVLLGLGYLLWLRGEYDAAESMLDEALQVLEPAADRARLASAYSHLGIVADLKQDIASASARHQRALEIRREMNDLSGVAASLNNLGLLSMKAGDYNAAEEQYEESLQIDRELGDDVGLALSGINLGLVSHHKGDLQKAASSLASSIELLERLDDRRHIAIARNNLSMVLLDLRDLDRARTSSELARLELAALGDKFGLATALEGAAQIALACNDWSLAAANAKQALSMRQEIGDVAGVLESAETVCLAAAAAGKRSEAEQLIQACEGARAKHLLKRPPRMQARLRSLTAGSDAQHPTDVEVAEIVERALKL
jgi:tetratricopeptide (TPR) repeat protein